VGDIVIGERLYQHDIDARPLMTRFEIPLTGKTHFQACQSMNDKLEKCVGLFLVNNPEFLRQLENHSIHQPHCYRGDIASGDLFVAGKSMRDAIARNLPSVLCVEMEGAAVAQVCDDYGVDVAVIRFISDTADNNAHNSATNFLLHHASSYSLGILEEYFQNQN
jgi:adenosylhomocysteine nucleosidase